MALGLGFVVGVTSRGGGGRGRGVRGDAGRARRGGFGGADRVRHVFSQERPARTGRHPRRGEGIEIAASTGPSFKVGKTLRDAVR